MENTKKNLCRLTGILLAAGLMLPTPVQAAQSTARVANDPIDISTLKVGYDLRDENDSTIWSKDGTVEYQGEYSCAVTPQVRQAGNRLSGLTETAYASLLA